MKLEKEFKFLDYEYMYEVTYKGEVEYFKTLRGIVGSYDELSQEDVPHLYQVTKRNTSSDRFPEFTFKRIISDRSEGTTKKYTSNISDAAEAIREVEAVAVLFTNRGMKTVEEKWDSKKYYLVVHLVKEEEWKDINMNPVKLTDLWIRLRRE